MLVSERREKDGIYIGFLFLKGKKKKKKGTYACSMISRSAVLCNRFWDNFFFFSFLGMNKVTLEGKEHASGMESVIVESALSLKPGLGGC